MELSENERFALLRRRAGLRQSEVAEAAGLSRPYVSLYESAKIEVSEETVSRLWQTLEKLRQRQSEDVA